MRCALTHRQTAPEELLVQAPRRSRRRREAIRERRRGCTRLGDRSCSPRRARRSIRRSPLGCGPEGLRMGSLHRRSPDRRTPADEVFSHTLWLPIPEEEKPLDSRIRSCRSTAGGGGDRSPSRCHSWECTGRRSGTGSCSMDLCSATTVIERSTTMHIYGRSAYQRSRRTLLQYTRHSSSPHGHRHTRHHPPHSSRPSIDRQSPGTPQRSCSRSMPRDTPRRRTAALRSTCRRCSCHF